jgi:hypothetical protein
MRWRGTLQNTVLVAAGYGNKDSYTDVDGVTDVYGSLKRIGGNRSNDNGETVFSNRWEWIVRKHADLSEKLGRGSRWVIDGRYFGIDGYEYDQYYYRFILSERG